MSLDTARIDRVFEGARSEGRSSLLEPEALEVLEAAGVPTPRAHLLPPDPGSDLGRILRDLPGDRIVLKVVSPLAVHKTEIGGVRVVEREEQAVRRALVALLDELPSRFRGECETRQGFAPPGLETLGGAALEARFRESVRGVLAVEFLRAEGGGWGDEVFVGLRHTREFGHVLSAGAGGIDTELLAAAFRRSEGVATAAAHLVTAERFVRAFVRTVAGAKLTGRTRGGRARVPDSALCALARSFLALAARYGPGGEGGVLLEEIEVNPFIACGGRLVAADARARLGPLPARAPERPLEKMRRLFEPRSAAVLGVSSKGLNMGRIILQNLIRDGFDPSRLAVVKEGEDSIDGVRCYPAIAALPSRMDLVVLAVGAPQVPGLLDEIVAREAAESVVLIPGGIGEMSGSEALESRIKARIEASRALPSRGPLVVGPNSLGIISRPGRYDTLFIPETKLPKDRTREHGVAIISQSGAYMITRLSKLRWLTPRYCISAGNQIDLAMSDFFRYVSEDPAIHTIACYIEGFRDLDGLRFAEATERATRAGRDVIVYKAGRTEAGRAATAGHTAAVAGDYEVSRSVLEEAGAIWARTFTEFEEFLRLSALLQSKRCAGRRIGLVSNAGYECVGFADHLTDRRYRLELARIGPRTREAIAAALASARLTGLVEVRNPLDLTPMAPDSVHEACLRAMLDDEGVDCVAAGVVPLSPAVATLPDDPEPSLRISSEKSIARRFPALARETVKPLVAVIDSGPLFDPLAFAIEQGGVPTFRSADRALWILGRYLDRKLRNEGTLEP